MNTPPFQQHISSQFNAELEDIRQRVLAMGGIVEQQIAEGTRALIELDDDLAREVLEAGQKVNALEKLVDEECSLVLLRRQPTASDLRLVLAVMRVIKNLERAGDEAEKIAKMALDLSTHERLAYGVSEVGHMSRHVSEMIHDALDALARMDTDLALKVAKQDQAIDREYEAILRQCITFMMEDPRTIRRVMDIIWSVRALERIGDHAKNIAKHVIYFVEGKDVRHVSLDKVERELRAES